MHSAMLSVQIQAMKLDTVLCPELRSMNDMLAVRRVALINDRIICSQCEIVANTLGLL